MTPPRHFGLTLGECFPLMAFVLCKPTAGSGTELSLSPGASRRSEGSWGHQDGFEPLSVRCGTAGAELSLLRWRDIDTEQARSFAKRKITAQPFS